MNEMENTTSVADSIVDMLDGLEAAARKNIEADYMRETLDLIFDVLVEGAGDSGKIAFGDYRFPHREMICEITRIIKYRMPDDFKDMEKIARRNRELAKVKQSAGEDEEDE